MEKFHKYLSDALKDRLATGTVKRTYAPPPAPTPRRAVGGSSGVSGGAKPVARPVVAVPRSTAPSAAPIVRLPPPPTFAEQLASHIRPTNVVPIRAGADPVLASVANTGSDVNYGAQDAPPPEEPWQVWQSPDGTDVAVPSSYTAPEDWTTVGDPITDSDAIQRASESPISYTNQPVEIQDLFTQPDQRAVWSPETPRRGPEDDIFPDAGETRSSQEAERERQAGMALGGIPRVRHPNQTPITIQSDFARQQAEQQSADQAAQRAARRYQGMSAKGTPIAIDPIVTEQQPQVAPQGPVRGRNPQDLPIDEQFVIVQNPNGTYQAMPRAAWDAQREMLEPEGFTQVGGTIDADTAQNIMESDLTDPTRDQSNFPQNRSSLDNPWSSSDRPDDPGILPDVSGAWDSLRDKWDEDWKPIVQQAIEETQQNLGELDPIDALDPASIPKAIVQPIIKKGLKLIPTMVPDELEREVTDLVKGGYLASRIALEQALNGDHGEQVRRALDGLTFIFNTPIQIPGTEQRITLWNAIKTALETTLNTPQQYSVEQGIDAWYTDQTGEGDGNDSLFDTIVGTAASAWAETTWGITSMPEWLDENRNRAIQVYRLGIDTDGDGQIDVTGSEAVIWLYRQEASAWDQFVFDTVTDPYNAAILAGAGGRAISGFGRGLRLSNEAPAILRAGGAVLEYTGKGIEGASKLVEGVGDLGLGYVPDALYKGARRLPGVGGLFDTSPGGLRREAEDAFDEATGAARRAERSLGNRPVDVERTASGDISGVKWADGTVEDLTTDPIRATAIDRRLNTTTLDPRIRADAVQIRALNALNAAGVTNAATVPPRYLRPIANVLALNPGREADIIAAIDRGLPAMREHVLQMEHAYGAGGITYADAAIDTSVFTHRTFRPAFGDLKLPDYRMSTPFQPNPHRQAETILAVAWDDRRNVIARSKLYRSANPNEALLPTLPPNPTREQVAQAERYASLVEQHQVWHPGDVGTPSFDRALAQARAIRERLAELGIAPRRNYTMRIPTPRYVQDAAASGLIDGTRMRNGNALENVAARHQWDEAHAQRAVSILNDIRTRTGARPITAADLHTPAGRAYMNDLNILLDKRDGIANLNPIVFNNPPTSRLYKNANHDLERLRKEVLVLERKLGVRPDGTGARRIANSKSIIPEETSKAAKAYVQDADKLTRIQHMSRSQFRRTNANRSGIVVDQGGIAWMATPYGDVPLTPDQLANLTKQQFANGETPLDRWIRHINSTIGDVTKAPDEILENARLATRDDLVKRMKELHPTREPGIIGKTWDRYTEYLRDSILGTWLSAIRYWSNTTFGNMGNLILGGYGADFWKTLHAKRIVQQAKDLKHIVDVMDLPAVLNDPLALPSDKIAVKYGYDNAPEIRRQFRTDHALHEDTLFGRWATRHKVPGPVKKVVGATVTGDQAVLNAAQGMDMVMRDAVMSTASTRELRKAIPDFRDAALERMQRAGFTEAMADATWRRFRAEFRDGFAMADVQRFFRDAGLPEGIADRLGRDWQSAVNTIRSHARAEVKRVTLAGRETNLDSIARRYVMFSYFTSRQYWFLLKQGLKHPGLINAYLNYQTFVEDYLKENPDMPAWMEGMLRITGLPGGTSLLFNPTALWQAGNLFQNGDGFDATLMEQLFQENPWVFFHPGIQAVLNMGGFLGDNRDVDPFNTHNLGRYEAYIENLLRYTGVIKDGEAGLKGNRSDDFWNQARDWLSGKFDALPGAEYVPFVESADQENAELRALALDEATKMGMDPNDPGTLEWIEQQMADPESDLYQRAMERYLWDEGIGLTAKLLPLLASGRPITRQMNHKGEDLMGNLPDEWKAYVRSPDPRGRAMQMQQDEYYSAKYATQGGVASDYYNEIVYGTPTMSVIIDGVEYTPDEIMAMDTERRQDLFFALLADTGTTDAYNDWKDTEDRFFADPDNAEYTQLHGWRTAVYDYEGGPDAYWEAVIQNNPNAARYYESLDLENMTDEEREQALTSSWAFMAIAGIQQNIYAPEPIDTNFYDPVDLANKAPQPVPYEPYVSDYEKDTRDQVAKYQKNMAQAQPVVRQILTDWGIDPNTPLNQLPYRTRFDVYDEYERRTGERVPYEKSDAYYRANAYFQWVDQQPAGADTSLEAYFAYQDEQYRENLPEDFNAEEEYGDTDPYQFYDNSRSKDPGYRYEDED